MDIISNNRGEVKYFFTNFSSFFTDAGFFTESAPRDKIKQIIYLDVEIAKKEVTITTNDAGLRLDLGDIKADPLLPASLA